MIGQSSAQDEQKKQYDEWAANQQKQRQIAQAKQDQDRQIAETARNQGLQDVSADSQKQTQADEQARLTSYLQGQDQTSTQPSDVGAAADKTLLSGQQSGDEKFQSDLATKINSATADAKKRIAALAAVSSYGGSSGGLDVSNALAFQKSGEGIDMANDFRKGDLAAYGAQKAVDPLQIQYTPSPIAGLANQALSFGGQGLGKMLAGATVGKSF